MWPVFQQSGCIIRGKSGCRKMDLAITTQPMGHLSGKYWAIKALGFEPERPGMAITLSIRPESRVIAAWLVRSSSP